MPCPSRIACFSERPLSPGRCHVAGKAGMSRKTYTRCHLPDPVSWKKLSEAFSLTCAAFATSPAFLSMNPSRWPKAADGLSAGERDTSWMRASFACADTSRFASSSSTTAFDPKIGMSSCVCEKLTTWTCASSLSEDSCVRLWTNVGDELTSDRSSAPAALRPRRPGSDAAPPAALGLESRATPENARMPSGAGVRPMPRRFPGTFAARPVSGIAPKTVKYCCATSSTPIDAGQRGASAASLAPEPARTLARPRLFPAPRRAVLAVPTAAIATGAAARSAATGSRYATRSNGECGDGRTVSRPRNSLRPRRIASSSSHSRSWSATRFCAK